MNHIKNLITPTKNKTMLIVCIILAWLSVMEFWKLAILNNLTDQFKAWHLVHIKGEALAPIQYRVFSFYFPEILHKITHVGFFKLYIFERFLFTFSFLYVFYKILEKEFSLPISILILTVWTLFYNLSTLPHIQPSEEPNLFFFALCLYALNKDSKTLFLISFLFGTFTKETTLFLIPYTFLYYLLYKEYFKSFLYSILLCVIYASGFFGIRYFYGTERDYLGELWQVFYNWEFILNNPHYAFLPYSFTMLPALWMIHKFKQIPIYLQASLPIIFIFIIGHFMISKIQEFRTYAVLCVWTLPGLFLLLKNIEFPFWSESK